MTISITCRGCGEKFEAPQRAEGTTVRCPHCFGSFRVRQQDHGAVFEFLEHLENESPAPSNIDFDELLGTGQTVAAPAAPRDSWGEPAGAWSAPGAAEPAELDPNLFRSCLLGRFGYLLFALVLIPLIAVTFVEDDVAARIGATLDQHRDVVEKLKGEETIDGLLAALPGHRVQGAFLPRDTFSHWLMAILSSLSFLTMVWLVFERGPTRFWQLACVALFTATAGILLLTVFQFVAEMTQNLWLRGGNVVILALFYLVKFIGFSYRAALDPESGFVLSFLGFVCAVGLCEEITKMIPLWNRFSEIDRLGWRGMGLWGLASGIGFGVAEGIMYSGDHYNGLSTGSTYLVRFVSCVGLHSMWCAAVGVSLYKRRDDISRLARHGSGLVDMAIPLLRVAAVPMILHGLYDTMLKQDLNIAALVVAGLSFAWLAWQIETARGGDRELLPAAAAAV
jgi:RsiW-degrading membrane proteinase PrsW (M82 family)